MPKIFHVIFHLIPIFLLPMLSFSCLHGPSLIFFVIQFHFLIFPLQNRLSRSFSLFIFLSIYLHIFYLPISLSLSFSILSLLSVFLCGDGRNSQRVQPPPTPPPPNPQFNEPRTTRTCAYRASHRATHLLHGKG
jgi:hypothetical protein